MRKLAAAIAVAVSLSLILVGGALAAPEKPSLNWGSEVNAAQCPAGKLVINVTFKVINDADSGMAGNYWAFDNYNKQIQVWDTGAGNFCAAVRYTGKFTTVEGPSPGTTGTVAAGITGAFEGGYQATFTGVLLATPAKQTKGNIGQFDYGWDGTQAGAITTFDWLGTYFTSTSGFAQPWWGWIYHAGKNGTWVNASAGPSGDIKN